MGVLNFISYPLSLMKTLDFSKKFLHFDWTELNEIAPVVADIVAWSKEQPVKMFDMACRIFKDKKVELDAADTELLKKTIENSGQNAMVLGQILKLF